MLRLAPTRRQQRRLNPFLRLLVATALMPPLEMAAQAAQPFLPPVAYQRLDSLEQAALSGPTFAARLNAVSTISRIAIGQGDCIRGPVPTSIEYPGLVNSLASIYWRSRDASLRRAILRRMLWQVECAEAVKFLSEAATEAPPPSTASSGGWVRDGILATSQSDAVSLLVTFGPLGEPALRRLHAEGAVRDSLARAFLERLSRNDFHREP